MAEKDIEEVRQNKERNERDEDDYGMDKDNNDEIFKLLQISIYRHRKGKENRFCLDSLHGAMGFT